MSPSPERHLPLRKRDLVDLCGDDPRLPAAERTAFRDFCRILESVFHFEFHAQLEQLKQCHAPFDPDADAPLRLQPSRTELQLLHEGLAQGLTQLLQAANYEPIEQAKLVESLRGESLFKVRLAIDFDDFAQMLLFRRGCRKRTATVRTWGGLKKRTISFENFDRVALMVRFRDQPHFDRQQRRDLSFVPGSTVIKLFRNVPAADLEMLFPNTEVRMKVLDKVMIGVPAAIGGILVVATKLLSTVLLLGSLFAFWLGFQRERVELDQTAMVALAVGLGTLGVYVWKQVNRFKTRKIRFLKALTENLYFKNLDNNAGVFHRLLDEAEEEECKEAILAYWWLLTTEQALAPAAIDQGVEAWLRERADCVVAFEIGDAMAKLERLRLVTRTGDVLSAVSLEQAKAELDRAWDGYFQFGAASSDRPS
ncbi:MAG: TMEM143 family protein [Planctomycetota bacterium]